MIEHIGIDIDGVLSCTLPEIIKGLNSKYGHKIQTSDITNWWLEKCTPATVDQVIDVLSDPATFANPNPVKQGPQSTRRLIQNYHVHLVTNRPESSAAVTTNWLNRHNVGWNHLIFTKDKLSYAKKYEITVFVEDSPENALQLADYVPVVYLIDYPYNRVPLPNNVVRVYGWRQIMSKI